MNYSVLFRIRWSCFFVLVSSSFAIAQIGWQAQTNGVPAGQNLYALKAINTSEVWICGADGVILRTFNGGATWSSANPLTGGIPLTEQLVAFLLTKISAFQSQLTEQRAIVFKLGYHNVQHIAFSLYFPRYFEQY